MFLLFLCLLIPFATIELPLNAVQAKVRVGIDVLFTQNSCLLKGKKIGLITNHTAIDSEGNSTLELFKKNGKAYGYFLDAIFAPEHGLFGVQHADKAVIDMIDPTGIPIYSLHGETRRPTSSMLRNINLLVFDIQDVGSRSYTYCSTLFYAMEEAAKARIPVIVLDRPNPMGGLMIDGPVLEERWRSFVGYINVPYCHGLTIGELARYFNEEYRVGCQLTVIPMQGWKRSMTFDETGLTWIPTSPYIPDAKTAYYYPTTGILGELQLVNIGIGYSLPFKTVGAPWINATQFADQLNAQKLPGVRFHPFHYSPFYGRFAKKECHGVLIAITDPQTYLPVTTQYVLIGLLKSLYPSQFQEALLSSASREEMFNKVNGTSAVYEMIKNEPYVAWKLRAFGETGRQDYLRRRQPYLTPSYQ
jgi:uncharacterized protein YbbC (DUF1343 family)